jgi:hypothetical protein
MRHYFSRPARVWHSNGDVGGTLGQLRPIPGHPGGMHPPPPPGLLTASARSAQRHGGVPVRHNRHRSRSARDRSSCTRRPRSRTTRTRTDGQTPGRSARHRRRGVDERRPRQDTRPACVLSGTVWGAAPGQNGQIQSGAVLTLNSARRPPACRGTRCRSSPEAAATSSTSHPLPIMPTRGRVQMPPPRHDAGSHRHSGAAGQRQ